MSCDCQIYENCLECTPAPEFARISALRDAALRTPPTETIIQCTRLPSGKMAHVFNGTATVCRCGAEDQFGRPVKTAFMLTLDEYERLSAEYLKEFHQVYKGGEFDPALLLSDFLLWLKKKERGNGETKS